MISFPNAKINLGLHITAKRQDGYHEIDSVFYPIGWTDALELIEGGNQDFTMSFSGIAISGDIHSNLCYKAWQLLKADFTLPNLQAHLHKVIPMGAGLGGGSSDAAFMLKLINNVCDLKISNQQLMMYAAQLGSDCPFFIENKPMIASGRGEVLNNIEIDLTNYHIAIVMPPICVSTSAAYSWILPSIPSNDLLKTIQSPITNWKNNLVNDFENVVCKHHPIIANIKQQLYDKGAIYASMSGSGAAVFGVFKSLPDLKEFDSQFNIFISGL
jgi:4-diphosphocytidyl-2-C-methyl-D-erythritol kinase